MVLSMHLTNIQSWKDETIEFSEDLVNVVAARSEKGKTVLFKVFYQMVFPNYYKFGSRNDLIRRGCYFGEVEFELSNFTKILFHLEHKEQWFKMKRPCDEDWVAYYQSNCPNEIINELGLVVDYELQYILNIYIKDNQYPFINTTKTWNAVLFNQVFKNEKLDKVIEFLSSELQEFTEVKKKLNSQLSYKKIQDANLTYTDIDQLELMKGTIDSLNSLYDVIDEIRKVMIKYEDSLRTYESLKDKVFSVVDINSVKELYVTLSSIQKVTEDLEPNLNVVEHTPDCSELGAMVSSIRKIDESVSRIQNNSFRIEERLKEYSFAVKGIQEVTAVKNDVSSIAVLVDVINGIKSQSERLESKLVEFDCLNKEVQSISDELEEVKSKIEICPTCKRPL